MEGSGVVIDFSKPIPDELQLILGLILGIWERYKTDPSPQVFEELGDMLDHYANVLRGRGGSYIIIDPHE